MRRAFRWAAILGCAGAVLGGLLGFLVALSSDCHIDHDGTLPAGACFRFLGMYLSGTTKYVAAGALGGAGLGVAVGIFLAVPLIREHSHDRSSAVHPLEVPAIWFGLQLAELFILIPALLFWIPDPGVWPEALRVGIWVVVLVGVTALNYAIRRRYIPR
jgi:hypothetical protein